MLITFCSGKLHCVRVTDACLNYEGSITIGRDLMKAAGMVPFQLVHINSMANAEHWETYVIPGRSGEICLNGCPARLFQAGDQVIILALAHGTPEEAAQVKQRVVYVNNHNKILRVGIKTATDSDLRKAKKRKSK
jgi:aspartate 1-decarboxylase